jgi:DNA-directed RNA polymerase beta' subunit
MTLPQIFKMHAAYQLRLMSDAEMLQKAEHVYDATYLTMNSYTLDSALFGATIASPICSICFQHVEDCIGHYSVIRLPFPIVRAICLRDFKILIELICPCCSSFLIDNAKDSLKLSQELRLAWIRKEVEREIKDNTITCPICSVKVSPIKITQAEPAIRYTLDMSFLNINEQFNPIYVHSVLQEFHQIEEGGFSSVYKPADFMTQYIPIIPNKLRPKTLLSSQSNLTGYYKVIIEELCPELEKVQKLLLNQASVIIEKGTTLTNFNKYYDKLFAYYLLITDNSTDTKKSQELDLINKRDRAHSDQYIGLLKRFKDKSKSIFSNGIVATRHNISCRTVLGGAFDGLTHQISVPEHIANKMCMLYPVYAQNLAVMKQLVASMSDVSVHSDMSKPRVYAILNGQTGKQSKISLKDANTKAAMLKPGDKLLVSLISNDWVLHVRFPSIREESWSSYQIFKDKNSIISIPLPTCEMKSADLDGDEAQMLAMYAHTSDLESLLLHSIYSQKLGYKHSKMLVWFEEDVFFGMQRIKPGYKLYYYDSKVISEGKEIVRIVEEFLPPDLTYKDSHTEIVKGKFINERTDMNNHELFKYIDSRYNSKYSLTLLDKIIQLAYAINKDYGCTMGNDIKVHGDDNKIKIKKICEDNYKKIREVELSTSKMKAVLEKNISEAQKVEVKNILLGSIKGTRLEFPKFVEWKITEYYNMCVQLDYVITGWQQDRINACLAEGSRSSCAYPKYSVDPRAYGFNDRGYINDIRPYAQFMDCIVQRYNIYSKKAFTAKQGYFSKRLGITFGSVYVDYNGQVIDGYRILSPQYGIAGINPRIQVNQPLIDIDLNDKQFEEKYKSDKIKKLRSKILNDISIYRRLTAFVKTPVIDYKFVAGFNYEQFLNSITEEK